jgi:uncharacterized protein with GYD domain
MPKFLIEASYTPEGLRGLQKDKASGRLAAVKKALKAVDAELECLYWCLGDRDAIIIAEFPNTVAASALATAISASGLVRTTTTALLSAQDMDAALAKNATYQASGR